MMIGRFFRRALGSEGVLLIDDYVFLIVVDKCGAVLVCDMAEVSGLITAKGIGVNGIPAIREVDIFNDETVIEFLNPKVQAFIAANTWVVSNTSQTKITLPLM
ncbi:nascent polypeptide-associated complex subunit beta-like protein [Tanacetum coccineum]|uniref:Nascent polypeptide-associated complex subunit beta-like protein n=1 Tax=Tanacetum coccineum TaxID=301880 RepID=A0ABQ5D6R9_9ASTR